MKNHVPKITFILILALGLSAKAQIQHGSFKLINANTDEEIRTFTSDITHYLSEADSLNVVASPSGSYSKVRFTTNDPDHNLPAEGNAPYAYYGDYAGDYGFVPGVGQYFGWGATEGVLNFTVDYLDSNSTVVDTDTFTITFEQAPPSPSGTGAYWTQNGDDLNYISGNVGIGTADPGPWKLAVSGKIRAKEIRVETDWADYVFAEGYDLPTLEEVEKHIREEGHLLNVPSAKDVQVNGIELGRMNKLLLEKIEELTLYVIEQNKNQIELQKRLGVLKQKNSKK